MVNVNALNSIKIKKIYLNLNKMTNEEKGVVYDDCIRESERLQRINSKIKSEYVGNIPEAQQQVINENDAKIAFLVKKLESLFS